MGKSKSRNKSSLKGALHSQQSRLKEKQKATQVAEQLAKRIAVSQGKGKGKAKQGTLPPRVTVPFCPNDQILLIGEGNFSFARALIQNPPPDLEYLPGKSITATAYDTEDECYAKYPEARDIVLTLKEKGVEVLFGVDATKLEKVSALKGRVWNRIVWNFPHAGETCFITSCGAILKLLSQERE
jgi:25S rRNA (uracil2634-N3)-methyltransferase